MSWRSKSKWIAHLETSIPIESPPLCGYVETLLLRKLTTHQSRAARLPNFLARPDFPQAAGFADAKCQTVKAGFPFSIRMIIWIFCSDTLWWLCVFLLVQTVIFPKSETAMLSMLNRHLDVNAYLGGSTHQVLFNETINQNWPNQIASSIHVKKELCFFSLGQWDIETHLCSSTPIGRVASFIEDWIESEAEESTSF